MFTRGRHQQLHSHDNAGKEKKSTAKKTVRKQRALLPALTCALEDAGLVFIPQLTIRSESV